MALKRTTYSPYVRHYPMHIVPGGTKRMEGHVKEDKELDELCKKVTQLDQDMIENDNALEAHIEEVDEKYQEITDSIKKDVSNLDNRLGDFEDTGMVYLGDGGTHDVLTPKKFVDFGYTATATGNKPESGTRKKIILEQTCTFGFDLPFDASEFYVVMGHLFPWDSIVPGEPGYAFGHGDYSVSIKQLTTSNIQRLWSSTWISTFRSVDDVPNNLTGHGMRGYFLPIFKIFSSATLPAGTSIVLDSVIKGYSNINHFVASDFPKELSACEFMSHTDAVMSKVDSATLASKLLVSQTYPTVLP